MSYRPSSFTLKDYPFYCVGKVDKVEMVRFLLDNQLNYSYVWGVYFDCLNLEFFEHKMHVFTAIINKGFRI